MRYHMRERAWSLTEAFVIKNDAGHPAFEVRGKFFHIGDDLLMIDRHTGQQVAHIKQRMLSLLPHYDIYRNGQHWASVSEQWRLFGERFKVKCDNDMVFHVQGDIWRGHFDIGDDYGNLLATVSRQFSIFRDSYAVDIANGVDVPFILSLAIVIEMVKEHHEKRD